MPHLPKLKSYIFFSLFLLCSGCASYKIPTKEFIGPPHNTETSDKDLKQRKIALEHWLYEYIPRHRSQIRWYDFGHWISWSILGNDDHGIFGEEHETVPQTDDKISSFRMLQWTSRNPAHNFTFYVIGTAQYDNSEFTLLRASCEDIKFLKITTHEKRDYAGQCSGFFLALHGWRPFLSIRLDHWRSSKFYIGWRELGNFGVRLTPFAKFEKKGLN